MKRGKPLKRKTGLRADPEKVREFKARAAPLKRGSKGLARGEGLARGKRPPKGSNSSDRRKTAPAGPLSPLEWRRTVWELDGGRCVMCGTAVPRDADRWTWQAHHPIEKQKLPPERKYDPRNGVVTCRRCHERHTSWTEVIPGSRLPARCYAFARELGDRGLSLVNRAHPLDPAAGNAAAPDTKE